ncbi:hypothetical protein PDN41_13735 [Bacillus cereus]|nr:hypothetical protein [Bacillus cereus]
MKKADNILSSIRYLVPSKEAERLGEYSDDAITEYQKAVNLRISDPHLEAEGAEKSSMNTLKKVMT